MRGPLILRTATGLNNHVKWDGTEDLQVEDPKAGLWDALQQMHRDQQAPAQELPAAAMAGLDFALSDDVELPDYRAELSAAMPEEITHADNVRFEELFTETSLVTAQQDFDGLFNDPTHDTQPDDASGSAPAIDTPADLTAPETTSSAESHAVPEGETAFASSASVALLAKLWGAVRARVGAVRGVADPTTEEGQDKGPRGR